MIHDYHMSTVMSMGMNHRNYDHDDLLRDKVSLQENVLPDPTPIHSSRVNVVAQVHVADASVPFQEDETCWLISSFLKRRMFPTSSSTDSLMMQKQKKRKLSSDSSSFAESFYIESTMAEELEPSSRPAATETKFRKFQSEQWSVRYDDLVQFRSMHGHCLVARCQDADLAKWVKRQRYQFKLMQMGKHSTMTSLRVNKLEELGFIWNSHSAAWEERYTELQDFKLKHGHCRVPTTCPEYPQLSAWVQAQRRQFKLQRQGLRSTLNDERIQKLSSAGFDWEARKRSSIV